MITANGQTYDRSCIEEWFKRYDTDPLTNTVVAKHLIPNRALKGAISDFNSSHAT